MRKVVRSGATAFAYDRDVQPRPKLGRWSADLDELLAGNLTKAAREQLTLIRIAGAQQQRYVFVPSQHASVVVERERVRGLGVTDRR